MKVSSCFKIGFVLKTHGLKGEVTIALDEYSAEDMSSIQSLLPLFVDIDKRLVPFFIESMSSSGSKVFVKFEDVNSVEDAAKLVKRPIYLQKSARPKAGKGEFYDDEVIDFSVTDETVGPLGKIVEVIKAGPNRLLVLDHQGKEVLIPINSPFIIQINKSKRMLTVNLPEGFLDI
jgi:16S rRNA processing protein RimM